MWTKATTLNLGFPTTEENSEPSRKSTTELFRLFVVAHWGTTNLFISKAEDAYLLRIIDFTQKITKNMKLLPDRIMFEASLYSRNTNRNNLARSYTGNFQVKDNKVIYFESKISKHIFVYAVDKTCLNQTSIRHLYEHLKVN